MWALKEITISFGHPSNDLSADMHHLLTSSFSSNLFQRQLDHNTMQEIELPWANYGPKPAHYAFW